MDKTPVVPNKMITGWSVSHYSKNSWILFIHRGEGVKDVDIYSSKSLLGLIRIIFTKVCF